MGAAKRPSRPQLPPYRVVVHLEGARLWLSVLLGGALVVDAIVQAGTNATELVVALVLLGMVSADPVIVAVARRIERKPPEPPADGEGG
jgi:hypothetical protein